MVPLKNKENRLRIESAESLLRLAMQAILLRAKCPQPTGVIVSSGKGKIMAMNGDNMKKGSMKKAAPKKMAKKKMGGMKKGSSKKGMY